MPPAALLSPPHSRSIMTAYSTFDIDRRTRLNAASALFDSLGEVLLCVDGDLKIAWAPSDLREIVGSPVEAVLGADVDSLLRQGKRADTRAILRTARGTRGVTATLAPCVSHGELGEDIRYV